MKAKLGSILKIAVSLGLGIFLIWLVYKDLSENDKQEIANAFAKTNYWYLLASCVFGIMSHLSRAWRWKYTLEPVGIHPKFYNSFFTVMVGYLANLAIPRMGEVSRCVVMGRYENVPFSKLFGTLITERIIDMLILLSLIITLFLVEFDVIGGLFFELFERISTKFGNSALLLSLLAIIGSIGAVVFFRLLKSSQSAFFIKLRTLVEGVTEGIQSIGKMKQKGWFIFHTFFIWFNYIAMASICFFALPETADVPLGAILGSFVIGGVSLLATQGGLGAYPLAVQQILLLYGVGSNVGYAFGWITWTTQTLLILLLGFLSLILLPIFNKQHTDGVSKQA